MPHNLPQAQLELENILTYLIVGGPGMGKSTLITTILSTTDRTHPQNWKEQLHCGDDTEGVTSECTPFFTAIHGDTKICLIDCPGVSGPKGKPIMLSKSIKQVCDNYKLKISGIIFVQEITNPRINSTNELMGKLAPCLIDDKKLFWSQSIFVGTKFNLLVEEADKVKKIKAFSEFARKKDICGEFGSSIKEENIIRSTLDIKDSELLNRLMHFAGCNQNLAVKEVSNSQIFDMCCELNGIEAGDSEEIAALQKALEDEKIQADKKMKETQKKFDELQDEVRKQSKNNSLLQSKIQENEIKFEQDRKQSAEELSALKCRCEDKLEKFKNDQAESQKLSQKEYQDQLEKMKKESDDKMDKVAKDNEKRLQEMKDAQPQGPNLGETILGAVTGLIAPIMGNVMTYKMAKLGK